jgi:hypothetical protein
MANRFELMTGNVCQMLKELVQTAGVAVRAAASHSPRASEPCEMKLRQQKTTHRVACKVAAIAYADLTFAEHTVAARIGAADLLAA